MYFDPGFGSMLIQMIVAGIATFGIYFASTKSRIKDLFSKKNKQDQETDAAGEGEDDEL